MPTHYRSAVSGRPSLYKRLASILESDVSCDNITRINSKLKYYSHEINKIIGRQARIAHALKNPDLVDITVNKLYVLMSKSNYIPKVDLSNVARQIKYHALRRILDNISRLEQSSKKFDTPESTWFWRKDFTNFSYLDKANFIKIVDKIIGLSKDVVFMDSIFSQKILIESLETIATTSSGNKFRNFLSGGKVRTARDNAKRLLGCDVNDIISNINDLRGKAKRGSEIWEDVNKLLHFMNEDGINKFTKEISRARIDLFHSQLVKIKEGP
jgi:hypothetical protein